MRIGIDISQIAYEKTGVGNYVRNLVKWLLKIDNQNEYVFFFSSMRRSVKNFQFSILNEFPNHNFQFKKFPLPPTFLDILWNKLHICPIEWFIGDVDIFLTSDWTEPPTKKAKKATILYDLSIYKYSQEMDSKIVRVQKRKLNWVKKESNVVFCISNSTKKDALEILGIEESRLKIIYPGGIC